MPLPKLTPLQSRFAASLIASVILLLLLYLSLNKPNFAYAVELDSRIPPDHNHPILDEPYAEDDDEIEIITPRATGDTLSLSNNAPLNMNIGMDLVQYWVFPKSAIDGPAGQTGPGLPGAKLQERDDEDTPPELRKRQTSKTVYITLNTCLQPESNSTDRASDVVIPPQLTLYVSQSASNKNPGPNSTDTSQQAISFDGGFADAILEASTDVYIGVSSPNVTGFTGSWNYEIAASIDAPFHAANASYSHLFFVDGDNHAALLITDDMTQAAPNDTVYQEWMNIIPPYGLFAHNHNDPSILGVKNSYCGLKNNARISANLPNVDNQNVAKMTNRGLGGKPKEQFYVTALEESSQYWGFLAMAGNSTASGNGVVGGGGTVWAAINFTTKAEDNCALMYNLSFCSEVAYAVPTNPGRFSPTTGLADLAALYDSYAAQMYQYFNYSLQQIPCNTTSSAQYSLARNCDDCARAYKQWLCAVTIPRCADFSNTDPWLQPRNVGQPFVNGSTISSSGQYTTVGQQALLDTVASNSSRNPNIDTAVQPGPYKEVLPCEDLCYDLVQSCPAALGFGCPAHGHGLEDSYGSRSNDSGKITCSYLGAAYYLSAAGRDWTVGWLNLLLFPALTGLGLLLF